MRAVTEFINAPNLETESWATGLPTLDRVVGGFRRGQLWVITGSPRTGKSLLAIQFAHTLAVQHDFAVNFAQSKRDSGALTRARLVALSVGRQVTDPPDHEMPDEWPLTQDRENLAWLCAARLEISEGGLGLPNDAATGLRESIVIDDPGPVQAGGGVSEAFREVADSGRIVIVTATRSHCFEEISNPILGDRGERLSEGWASVADVIVEVVPDPESGYPAFLWIALNRVGTVTWVRLDGRRSWTRIQEQAEAPSGRC